ncbi:GDSL-type esterase/lipase family protein [Actinophytocola algeriensis]|uniref:Lysophospholipase L1-like esterase n=1 Tax=Actinophytocola algeriensis TaxID=1768010 RepID=A0A7W7VCJ3_9PSEU|nr:GDSL-type esterase/lipase family protein [Actinophytocola algeriensis]MBB4905099.1 lysophospholipase L1-like esterase [Actinophytocola algeriensis]MBE1473216.1 lysophospholipase L1-like esterase [Actinophytocola algeriensis]
MARVLRSAPIVALLVALTACTGEQAAPPAPTAPSASSVPTAPATTGRTAPADGVYVSVGDSYATGYRPADDGAPAGATRDGFAHLVAERTGMRLVNVGCSGATSASLRDEPGCAEFNRAPGAPDPGGRTQLDAAVAALRENEGRVGLVTVVIGGNDLTPCATARDVLTCTSEAVAEIQANLAAILPVLREAAGDAPIVGLTYPDVFLGAWVSAAFPDGQNLARQSVPLFRDFFNPVLEAEYEKVDATFADVTAATGAYEPLTETTEDPAYGPVPAPVAKVCALTYFCEHTDVHPTPAGHEAIAAAVLSAANY